MLATVLHLIPVLGAEKSKVPFYIAGAVLVIWALVLSMGIGRSRPDFPSNKGGERLVIAVTAMLVVLATAMAVVTSGGGGA
jgi:hypothetical protein